MRFLSILVVTCFASVLLSAEVLSDTSSSDASASAQTTAESAAELSAAFSEQQRWDIKRQVMSRPGVMLDMANMTDNGYVWKNDVVWAGDGLPIDEKWYVAGFLFQRPGYKSVWLQYAFRIDTETQQLRNVRRWYGAGSIR